MISGDFVSEGGRVGNVDRAPVHLDEAGAVQTSEIPRNELPNRSEPCSEFFIVFRELELNSSWSRAPRLVCQSQKVCDQTPPDRRERQIFTRLIRCLSL